MSFKIEMSLENVIWARSYSNKNFSPICSGRDVFDPSQTSQMIKTNAGDNLDTLTPMKKVPM